MNSSVPKQFMELAGKPVLIHTLERFQDIADHLILVLPENQLKTWEHIREKYPFNIRLTVTTGGETRFDSVKNGLEQIFETDGLVAIHDAVRPFVSELTIEKSYRSAEEHGSGVVSVPVKDSIRKVSPDNSVALNRDDYHLMQTPQTFRLPLILKAYENASGKSFTDDASVFENDGNKVFLLQGAYENLKITTPEDLYFGEAILKFQSSNANKFMQR
jgi:2-C-methyl-D-erythritol 4-phosphate cytidylyltransferase